MSKISLVVTFDVTPGRADDLMTEINAHVQRCFDNEEGCLYFDILRPRSAEGQVMLYEVYADDTALTAHRASSHLAHFREAITGMVVGSTVIDCTVESR